MRIECARVLFFWYPNLNVLPTTEILDHVCRMSVDVTPLAEDCPEGVISSLKHLGDRIVGCDVLKEDHLPTRLEKRLQVW
jgi:hypothetical protein